MHQPVLHMTTGPFFVSAAVAPQPFSSDGRWAYPSEASIGFVGLEGTVLEALKDAATEDAETHPRRPAC